MKRLRRNSGLTATEGLLRTEQDSQPQRSLYSLEEGDDPHWMDFPGHIKVSCNSPGHCKHHRSPHWMANRLVVGWISKSRKRWWMHVEMMLWYRHLWGKAGKWHNMPDFDWFSLSLKQHKVIGTESRSEAKSALAFKCSLERDLNTRHRLILLEHSETPKNPNRT